METYSALVFDEMIHGAGSYYTDARFNEELANPDRLSIWAAIDQISGTDPQMAVQIEQSCDGRNWANKNVDPEIRVTAIANPRSTLAGSDTGTVASQGLVRVRIDLSGTSPSAHVKLFVCGRSY